MTVHRWWVDHGRWAWANEASGLHVHNLGLDENIIPIQVEEDETLHHDLDITDSNGQGDATRNGVEGLYGDYDFN